MTEILIRRENTSVVVTCVRMKEAVAWMKLYCKWHLWHLALWNRILSPSFCNKLNLWRVYLEALFKWSSISGLSPLIYLSTWLFKGLSEWQKWRHFRESIASNSFIFWDQERKQHSSLSDPLAACLASLPPPSRCNVCFLQARTSTPKTKFCNALTASD